MNYYAQINESNFVENTVVADEEWISAQNGNWVEYTDENPAYIGGSYNPESKLFTSPKPFPSWTLNESNNWDPPVERPDDDKGYYWNEEELAWVEIPAG